MKNFYIPGAASGIRQHRVAKAIDNIQQFIDQKRISKQVCVLFT
jgi:hypothetical protein